MESSMQIKVPKSQKSLKVTPEECQQAISNLQTKTGKYIQNFKHDIFHTYKRSLFL